MKAFKDNQDSIYSKVACKLAAWSNCYFTNYLVASRINYAFLLFWSPRENVPFQLEALYASQGNKFQPNKQYIFETLSKNQAGMPTAHNKLLLYLTHSI